MEVDQIQCKFPRIIDGYAKFASTKLGQSQKMDEQHPDEDEEGQNKRNTADGGGGGVDLGGGDGRFYGWPSSRIVRVSRASGGKDRHSKVLTSKGPRDRRVRLSVNTAIQFYDLQDRLGYDQPSKAVEWLLTVAASSIAELPPMNSPFLGTPKQLSSEKRSTTAGGYQLQFSSAQVNAVGGGGDGGGNSGHPQEPMTKSSGGSSNSATSKGSISRSESRVKARERVKERAAEKEKEKENESSDFASFTELLSGRINCIHGGHSSSSISRDSSVHQDYFTNELLGPPATRPGQFASSPLFTAVADHHHHPELQPFSFAADNLVNSPGLATINRGTLQSNSPSPLSLLPRFPPTDRSPPNFFIGAASPVDNHHHFLTGFDARLQLYYCQKEKEKN